MMSPTAFLRSVLWVAAVVAAGPATAGGNSPAAASPVASGAAAPATARKKPQQETRALSLPDLDGVTRHLTEWQGKVILLNFWATWCSPCIQEIRDLVAYQEQYAARGLRVVGVGLDELRKLRNVHRTLEINYPVLVANPADNGNLVQRWGNVSGIIPYSVVLDRTGRVVYTHYGLINRATFEENILPLLDGA